MGDKSKITPFQATLLFLVMICSVNMRIIPKFTIDKAAQAAWLSPIIGSVGVILIIFIIKRFTTKYPNQVFGDLVVL